MSLRTGDAGSGSVALYEDKEVEGEEGEEERERLTTSIDQLLIRHTSLLKLGMHIRIDRTNLRHRISVSSPLHTLQTKNYSPHSQDRRLPCVCY